MNVLGAPAAEIVADMQQNLQEQDDAGLMDLYTSRWDLRKTPGGAAPRPPTQTGAV
jgi:hypothetical protein